MDILKRIPNHISFIYKDKRFKQSMHIFCSRKVFVVAGVASK